MYATPKHARTFALLGLLAACGGSSAKKDALDAKGMTPDGKALLDSARADTKVTIPDTSLARDARDATIVSDAIDGKKIDAIADASRDAGRDSGADVSGDGLATDAATDAGRLDATKSDTGKADVPANKDTGGEAGSIDAPLPNGCNAPLLVPWDSTSQHTEITVDTTQESHKFDLSCGTGGRDLVLMFRLQSSKNIVYADTFGTPWNTILQFSDTCPMPATTTPVPGTIPCNDDACGTTQSQATALLNSGYHYLIVSGVNDEAGLVTIHLQRAELSVNGMEPLPAGAGSIQGTNSGATSASLCQGAGPETTYGWISCPDYVGGALSASTCNGTTLDIVMSIQVPRTDLAVCANGDSCGMQELISGAIPPGAGINLLTVDGETPRDQGAFTMTYTRP